MIEFPQDSGCVQRQAAAAVFCRGHTRADPSASGRRKGAAPRGGRSAHRLLYRPRQPSDVAADMPALVAEAIGMDPRNMPRDKELSRLFEGKRADNGEAWSVHKRKHSGFDFVFSPHKSVSLAAEFAATPSESAAYWHAVDRANDRAMRYAAQVLGWARKGAGGEDGADAGAVGWVSFRHHTARPTLHLQDGRAGQTYL